MEANFSTLLIQSGIFFTLTFFVFRFSRIFTTTRAFFLLAASLIVIQLICAATLKIQIMDVLLGSGAGYHLRQGIDFYWIDQGQGSYPYFPFLIFLQAVLGWLTEIFPGTLYTLYVRLVNLVALVLVTSVVYLELKPKSLSQARLGVLLLLASPIAYLSVFYHAQSDVILLAFFLLGSFILFRETLVKNLLIGSFLYAASIASKTWSIIFLPAIFRKLGTAKTGILMVISGIFLLSDLFIYTRLVFGSRIRGAFLAALNAGGPIEVWGVSGLTKLLELPIVWSTTFRFIWLAISFTLIQFLLFRKKLNFWQNCFATVLSFYLITPNWGVQYIFWIVPFLSLLTRELGKKTIFLYSIVFGVYALLHYINITLGFNLVSDQVLLMFGVSLWAGLLLWGIRWYRSAQRV